MGKLIEMRLEKLERNFKDVRPIVVIFDGETTETALERSIAGDPLMPGEYVSYMPVGEVMTLCRAAETLSGIVNRVRLNDLAKLIDRIKSEVMARKALSLP